MADPIHVYLLLDVSASMIGAPLEALKQGIHLLYRAFTSRNARPVLLSVITYESTATEVMPLTDISTLKEISLPDLDAGGSSGLAKAFRLMGARMPAHRPTLVYLLTDGEPTDDWEDALREVRPRVDKIFGLACGIRANEATFDKLVDQAFWIDDLEPDALFSTLRALT